MNTRTDVRTSRMCDPGMEGILSCGDAGVEATEKSPEPRAAARDDGVDHWSRLDPGFVRAAAADRLRALGHHDRLRIIEALSGGPRNVREIAATVDMSSAAVSRHLRALHRASVVESSRRGNYVLYSLADREAARLVAIAYRGAGAQARRLRAIAGQG